MGYKYIDEKTLIGKTITEIKVDQSCDCVTFSTEEKKYSMHHNQECCESVGLEKVVGNPESIVGEPIKDVIYDTESENFPKDIEQLGNQHSWTVSRISFYTEHGFVEFVWLGVSNGYYGEGVDIEEL